MDSPFPGMDPYLEPHWRSVHHRLITYAGDRLQGALPARYRVEVEERVFVADCYRNGRYGEAIDYREEPRPPLEPSDRAWADARLREKGVCS